MDDTDRIRRLRHPARLRSGRLDRRGRAGVTRLLVALAAVFAVLLPGAPAWAHNALTEATPAKNAKLTKAPEAVKLRFLQKLDPDYTTITVSDADKRKVATSAPEIDGGTGSVTFDEPLPNGVFTVAYQVVSTDGHTVKGSYEFTLDDPSAVAPTTAPPSEAPTASAAASTTPAIIDAAPASNTGDSSSALGWIAGAAVLVFAGLAGFLFVRRRKA